MLHYKAPLSRVACHTAQGVQGTAHSTDNAAMIDAVSRSTDRLRGVGIVPAETPLSELKRMAASEVYALRFHHIAGEMKVTFSPLSVDAFSNWRHRRVMWDCACRDADAAELPLVPRLKDWSARS